MAPIVRRAEELLSCERAGKASCRWNVGSIKKTEYDPEAVVAPAVLKRRGDTDDLGVRATQKPQRARVVGVAGENRLSMWRRRITCVC